MNLPRVPIAAELFAQWQRARGGRIGPASRPFSRGWEKLLEDARLVSATERSDAERDARVMEAGGWIELTPMRFKPREIGRILIPLASEERWSEAFGFVAPTDEEARQIREFAWEPALAFVREARLNIPFTELRQLNDFIKDGARNRELVPIKERSLEIFGDEKRLDALLVSALFREGRLDERRDLRCEVIGVPLGWTRGPSAAAARPVIVLENAATWHSYGRWNTERGLFSAVVYGDGNRFVDGIRHLQEILNELGGTRPVLYFGDLDVAGIQIPQRASAKAATFGLPVVEPHLPSYRWLLELALAKASRGRPELRRGGRIANGWASCRARRGKFCRPDSASRRSVCRWSFFNRFQSPRRCETSPCAAAIRLLSGGGRLLLSAFACYDVSSYCPRF